MNKVKKSVEKFNPNVELLDISRHQEFLSNFDCGHEAFNSFIKTEADEYKKDGNGVTYLVFNTIMENDGSEYKELVGYYTLAANGIPCTSRIKLYEDEIVDGVEYADSEEYIPVIELKMFAVDCKYQDAFFEYAGECKPISAYIINDIVSYVSDIIETVVAAKMIYLQAIDEKRRKFYERNDFHCMKEYMHPVKGYEDDMIPMYMTLKEINILYEN